jgi:arylsulfatase A-like enzyme
MEKRKTGFARSAAAWATVGTVLSAATLMVATRAKAAEGPKQSAKPNIVFVLTDNLGYGELGCYGGGILRGAPTPRIDKLASEGVRFLNMNMETQCTPSRSSIQTGRFSIRSGTYAVPFGGVPDGLTQWEVTVGEALLAAGYATGYYGKWHLGSHDGRLPNDQGYDEWYGIPRTTDEAQWPSQVGYSTSIVQPEQIMDAGRARRAAR